MGLDQYLLKKTYIGNNWKDKKNQKKIKIKGIKQKRVTSIIEEVGYWRKTNSIHKWFVKNVQNGRDDCKEYHVTKEKLEKLLKLVIKVLENPDKASRTLPATSGFYFGSTNYDKYFFQDMKYTKKLLEKVIKEEGSFYYTSSW